MSNILKIKNNLNWSKYQILTRLYLILLLYILNIQNLLNSYQLISIIQKDNFFLIINILNRRNKDLFLILRIQDIKFIYNQNRDQNLIFVLSKILFSTANIYFNYYPHKHSFSKFMINLMIHNIYFNKMYLSNLDHKNQLDLKVILLLNYYQILCFNLNLDNNKSKKIDV